MVDIAASVLAKLKNKAKASASLLDLRFKYAFPTIVAGNLIASTFDFVIINRHALIHKSLVTCHIFYSKIKLANEI
ncbi:hypothetical protein [Sedimentibacter sp.]|uniref:hypothetical protein n=1 Tax=Sedimentibacter sp. TaxID=1960295 RepID=UPI00289A4CD8|nr:hypothetical protein [Sedimentibacter sp.]